MIKLKTLVESDCNCGDSCCATNESINENVGDLKKIVKELEKASKLHAGQSKALAKASKMHAGQAKRLQGHIDEMDEESVNEDIFKEIHKNISKYSIEGDFLDEEIVNEGDDE